MIRIQGFPYYINEAKTCMPRDPTWRADEYRVAELSLLLPVSTI